MSYGSGHELTLFRICKVRRMQLKFSSVDDFSKAEEIINQLQIQTTRNSAPGQKTATVNRGTDQSKIASSVVPPVPQLTQDQPLSHHYVRAAPTSSQPVPDSMTQASSGTKTQGQMHSYSGQHDHVEPLPQDMNNATYVPHTLPSPLQPALSRQPTLEPRSHLADQSVGGAAKFTGATLGPQYDSRQVGHPNSRPLLLREDVSHNAMLSLPPRRHLPFLKPAVQDSIPATSERNVAALSNTDGLLSTEPTSITSHTAAGPSTRPPVPVYPWDEVPKNPTWNSTPRMTGRPAEAAQSMNAVSAREQLEPLELIPASGTPESLPFDRLSSRIVSNVSSGALSHENLDGWAGRPRDERLDLINDFIVQHLQDDDFAALCEDMSASWRRIVWD